MNDTTDATTIFAPLWRRKWLILAVGIIVGVASYAYYKHQRPTYQSFTQVYLGAGAEEEAPGEKAGGKSRSVTTANEVAVINSLVVESVRNRLRAEGKQALLKGTKVRAKGAEKSQFITLTHAAHTPRPASPLPPLTA